MTSRVSFSAGFLRPFIRLVRTIGTSLRNMYKFKAICQTNLFKLILVVLINIMAFLDFYNEFLDEIGIEILFFALISFALVNRL